MIKLALFRSETRFDVAQFLSKGHLCKRHTEKLIEAGNVFDVVVALHRSKG